MATRKRTAAKVFTIRCRHCGGEKLVARFHKRQQYCSSRCAWFTRSPESRAAAIRKAVQGRVASVKRSVAAKVDGLSAREAFKLGYQLGWHRGVRYGRGDIFQKQA